MTPVDTATNTAGPPIAVGGAPAAVAITPDGKTAYVANYADGTVTPIDTATNTPAPPIAVGDGPQAVAITPDGKTGYVANRVSGTVTPINLATNTPGPPITIGHNPEAIAITPDGKTAYVADGGLGNTHSSTVTPIDTATNAPGSEITVGDDPDGIAITPDGKTAYVITTGSVTPISTATNTAGTPILFEGASPFAITIVPSQAPSAAFSATGAAVGSPTSFDASGSSAPDGTIASYQWDFGDGTSTTTASPTATHDYTQPGSYPVSLTVTDGDGCSTASIFTGQTAYCNGSPAATVQHFVAISKATSTSISTSNSTSNSNGPTAERRCLTSQLRLSLVRVLGATGHRSWDLALRNSGSVTCRLRGYPTVKLVNRRNQAITPRVIHNDLFPTKTVVLLPGQRAFFTLIYEIAGPCIPRSFTAQGLAVVPPGDSSRLLLHRQFGVCDASVGGNPTISTIRGQLGYA